MNASTCPFSLHSSCSDFSCARVGSVTPNFSSAAPSPVVAAPFALLAATFCFALYSAVNFLCRSNDAIASFGKFFGGFCGFGYDANERVDAAIAAAVGVDVRRNIA